jgi:hypothetical protein
MATMRQAGTQAVFAVLTILCTPEEGDALQLRLRDIVAKHSDQPEQFTILHRAIFGISGADVRVC